MQGAVAIFAEPPRARTPEGKTVSLGSIDARYLSLCKKGLKGDVSALINAINLMLEVQPALDNREAEGRQAREEIHALLGRMGVTAHRDLERGREEATRCGAASAASRAPPGGA